MLNLLEPLFEKARKDNTPTISISGASFKNEDPNERKGLVIATENNYNYGILHEPAKFKAEVDNTTAIYTLRHVTALVIEEYVIFQHNHKGSTVYKLSSEGDNTLVYYQYDAGSIYGLSGSYPIALEHEEEMKISSEEEWKDFILTMVSSKMLEPEEAARISAFKTSSFD